MRTVRYKLDNKLHYGYVLSVVSIKLIEYYTVLTERQLIYIITNNGRVESVRRAGNLPSDSCFPIIGEDARKALDLTKE